MIIKHYPLTSTPTTIQPTKKSLSYSDYDAGSESDRDPALIHSLKSTIQCELNDIYHEKESIIDKIKLKFERSLDRLVEKTLAGDDQTNKSDIISPFTDQSLNHSLPTIEQPINYRFMHIVNNSYKHVQMNLIMEHYNVLVQIVVLLFVYLNNIHHHQHYFLIN